MQQQKQYWKYQLDRYITPQKNITSNSNRFFSCPNLPKNIIQDEDIEEQETP